MSELTVNQLVKLVVGIVVVAVVIFGVSFFFKTNLLVSLNSIFDSGEVGSSAPSEGEVISLENNSNLEREPIQVNLVPVEISR